MTTPRPLHVLVIEDDPDTRANLRDILELDEYQVSAVGLAAEALAVDPLSQFAAIILDRRLPDGTAEELLPKLRQRAPAAAIMIVTGYADVQGAIAALRFGAVDYILKPINPDELRTRLRHVAERLRAQDQIRTLSSIPAESPDPVLRVGREGVLLYANSASAPLLEMWGCQAGEPLPSTWQQRIQDSLGTGSNRDVEVTCGPRIFSLRLAPLVGADYVNVYGRDITEHKRADDALRQERDFAESLVETAQAIVLVLDTKGRIVRYNRYLEGLSGYRLEEVKGQDWFLTFLPGSTDARRRELFLGVPVNPEVGDTCVPIRTRTGCERTIQWSNKTLTDACGRAIGILAIGHDITALKEAQQRSLRAERLAAIGQMMAVLSHESGNALARSQSCLEMLSWEVEDRPEALELIGRIRQAQDQLQQLYSQVRDFAAPLKLEREVWNLAGIWRQAWTNLSLLRQGRETVLCEDIAGVDLDCLADNFRLEQVFRNLLENSLAACKGPVRIEIQCAETEVGGHPGVRVSVRDNGPGLTLEQRQRIFEPFFTTKAKGTGLGMAIAKHIVEAHGGQIAVGANANSGAEILITLPREKP